MKGLHFLVLFIKGIFFNGVVLLYHYELDCHIFFTKIKKRLHSLEIIVYWMISSYLFQNFSAICYMNFKVLTIPNNIQLELAHFVNRIILIPLLMVLFLHFFHCVKTSFRKMVVYLGFIFLLVGLEWLSDILGVLNHVNWKTWWSFIFWIVALGILICFKKFFRSLLFKGGR
ncbi:hypothetical protein SAMN04488577_3414 [Bacillus sp. cl95]|uniref:hypothetical protein n=1 Tax=Bacillus sp. UNCCL13 TaxID=1502772 RepID=UPI0008E4B56C|nr:hypothetical protein [Bacillus sp. UNCCL13]SFB02576.1 hypothetical protein SAMN02799634_10498 [Bacillus sp. UNCCL13]SFQ89047.1 hypothetical protein SAMN04488577_3414 [Bacillus sp. cl95]